MLEKEDERVRGLKLVLAVEVKNEVAQFRRASGLIFSMLDDVDEKVNENAFLVLVAMMAFSEEGFEMEKLRELAEEFLKVEGPAKKAAARLLGIGLSGSETTPLDEKPGELVKELNGEEFDLEMLRQTAEEFLQQSLRNPMALKRSGADSQ
jgi:hypothetical protein